MKIIARSTKTYFSYVEPSQHVEYTSEILDKGPRGPCFCVTAHDDPNHPIYGSTATACWSTVLNMVRKERTRLGLGKTGTAVSGPEFFGFAMPEVASCIEGLEGAELCKNYVCRCLRMETGRKGSSRGPRRVAPITFVTETKEVEEERPSKRRAAQAASRKWKQMREEEEEESAESSSAEEEEEEDSMSDSQLDSEEEEERSSTRSRRSQKRTEPAKDGNADVVQGGVMSGGSMGMAGVSSIEMDEESKRIRMEQLF